MTLRLEEPAGPPGMQTPPYAETAVKLRRTNADQTRATGVLDAADDQVERLFLRGFRTVNSPVHRAVWDRSPPVELFKFDSIETPPDVQAAMDASMAVVRQRRVAGAMYNADGATADAVLQELAAAGYWRLLVDRQYGGLGVPFPAFAAFLTRMSAVDLTVAGLASGHGRLSAVDAVQSFGNDEQKRRFLPGLASGERLSAFALTDPGAGSDLSARAASAVLDGESYVVNGETPFITNIAPGRSIALVCLVEDKPAVLIVELPLEVNEHVQLRHFRQRAPRQTHNCSIVFRDFRVPKENLLQPRRGDGLTIARHGLNRSRAALCASAAGVMRRMLATLIPRASCTHSCGQPIADRELVRRRMGEMAALMVGCDALAAWCTQLIDHGYRAELECIVARIFSSEALKYATIEYSMKTHGGRAFLAAHPLGDDAHERLAPSFYEGDNELLALDFFRLLVNEHNKTYFAPVGEALADRGIKNPNRWNPAHAWALRGAVQPYARWRTARWISRRVKPELPEMSDALRSHALFACDQLQRMAVEISSAMFRSQLALAQRQCRMVELSQRCQNLVTILCTAMYGGQHEDEMTRDAADLLCQQLRNQYLGRRPSDQYFQQVTELGAAIADGSFKALDGVDAGA